MWHFVRVITEKDDEGSMLCNKETCPKMSAGQSVQSIPFSNLQTLTPV